jgi:hypothetical protein
MDRRSASVIWALSASALSLNSRGKNVAIGWSTPFSRRSAIAIPTSAEIMLFETDLTFAVRARVAPR